VFNPYDRNRNLLTDLKPEQHKVNGIGPNTVYSTRIGKAVLEAVLPGEKTCKILVSQVLYIPGLKYNLMSWNVLSEKGFRAGLKKGDNKILSENACKASTQESWHQRLGHIPGKTIVELKKHIADPERIINDAPATCDV
jgi:hypothetical protein